MIDDYYLPDSQFTRWVERVFEKFDPDKVIPWPATPVPTWARTFRPRVMLDLGCGLGGMAVSVITRLGQWGCLDDLETIVLIDHDGGLDSGGHRGLQGYLVGRISDTLASVGCSTATVEVEVSDIFLTKTGRGPDLQPLAKVCSSADLILASHITYFFDDGGGHRFVEALASRRLPEAGLLWLVIRDLDCPVYKGRRDLFEALGRNDPQIYNYSEYFSESVLPEICNLRLVDSSSISIDVDGVDRFNAVKQLMWRGQSLTDDRCIQVVDDIARNIATDWVPIYGETHFLLARGGN